MITVRDRPVPVWGYRRRDRPGKTFNVDRKDAKHSNSADQVEGVDPVTSLAGHHFSSSQPRR